MPRGGKRVSPETPGGRSSQVEGAGPRWRESGLSKGGSKRDKAYLGSCRSPEGLGFYSKWDGELLRGV